MKSILLLTVLSMINVVGANEVQLDCEDLPPSRGIQFTTEISVDSIAFLERVFRQGIMSYAAISQKRLIAPNLSMANYLLRLEEETGINYSSLVSIPMSENYSSQEYVRLYGEELSNFRVVGGEIENNQLLEGSRFKELVNIEPRLKIRGISRLCEQRVGGNLEMECVNLDRDRSTFSLDLKLQYSREGFSNSSSSRGIRVFRCTTGVIEYDQLSPETQAYMSTTLSSYLEPAF